MNVVCPSASLARYHPVCHPRTGLGRTGATTSGRSITCENVSFWSGWTFLALSKTTDRNPQQSIDGVLRVTLSLLASVFPALWQWTDILPARASGHDSVLPDAIVAWQLKTK